MHKIGYARCSSQDQNTDIQVQRLTEAGCQIIRAEKASGKSREGREELASILEFVRAGDELCVVRLDRISRSTRDALNIIHELDQKGAALTVLDPPFSTRDGFGPLLVTVLGMVGQIEREAMRERQRAGIEAAKKRNVYKGRKPSIPVERVHEMKALGLGPTAIAAQLKCSRMSVHRALKAASEPANSPPRV